MSCGSCKVIVERPAGTLTFEPDPNDPNQVLLVWTDPDGNTVTQSVCETCISDTFANVAAAPAAGTDTFGNTYPAGAPIITFTDGSTLSVAAAMQPVTSAFGSVGTTAAGTAIFEHSPGDGSPAISICEGFASVQTTTDCTTPGVGPDKMVRSVEVANKTLIVDAAAEHCSECGFTEYDSVISRIDEVGPITPDNELLAFNETVTITNPSPCREASVEIVGSWSQFTILQNRPQYTDLAPPIGGAGYKRYHARTVPTILLDGANVTPVNDSGIDTNHYWYFETPCFEESDCTWVIENEESMYIPVCATIPPGGSIDFTMQLTINWLTVFWLAINTPYIKWTLETNKEV